MATNPDDIRLDKEEKASLARVADKNGKPWREVFRTAIATYEQGAVPADEVDIDEEIRAVLGVEPDAVEDVSLEEMRRILAKCPSRAADIIADREDRL
jgi:hypothetical protein